MTEDLSPQKAEGQIDWDAVGRYLAGESSQAESDAVRAWLATRPLYNEMLAKLDAGIQRLAARPSVPVDVKAALQQVRSLRDAPAPTLNVIRGAAPRAARAERPRWRTLGVPLAAAAAAGAIVLAGLLRSRSEPDVQPTFAARTITTSVGQTDSLRLQDGTFVHIAPGSRLTIGAGYGAARREIELDGKAYFEVQHDSTRPFIVRAGSAVIQDLGTGFVVDRIDADYVRVIVTSGVVALRDAAGDSVVELREGDVGELQPPRRPEVRRRASSPDDVAWRSGRLVFRDASFETVRAELKRWYGIELRVAESALAQRRLSAEFAGEPADAVLRAIALSLGAEVERRGDVVTLRTARGR